MFGPEPPAVYRLNWWAWGNSPIFSRLCTLDATVGDRFIEFTCDSKVAHGMGVPLCFWVSEPKPTSLAIALAASPPYFHGLSTNRCAPVNGSAPVNPVVSSGLAGLRGPVSGDE